MLTGKYYAKRKKVQELFNSSLLGPGDFNVRVTVVDKSKINSENAWKEVFRDAIGGGILHDCINQYYIDLMTGSGKGLQTAYVGYEIINKIFNDIKNEDIIRINLIKFPTDKNNPKSWIVIRV